MTVKRRQSEATYQSALTAGEDPLIKARSFIYATGYGSRIGWAALIYQEVTDEVGKCWGTWLRHCERPRTMAGRTAQYVETHQGQNRWFHGGNQHRSRHYSKYWACNSRLDTGASTPVYVLAETYQRSRGLLPMNFDYDVPGESTYCVRSGPAVQELNSC